MGNEGSKSYRCQRQAFQSACPVCPVNKGLKHRVLSMHKKESRNNACVLVNQLGVKKKSKWTYEWFRHPAQPTSRRQRIRRRFHRRKPLQRLERTFVQVDEKFGLLHARRQQLPFTRNWE
ncbi:hypothetical protein H0H93_016631, partial [Arthromyces matolae]